MLTNKQKEILFYSIGGIIGMIGGYLYWYVIGCAGGSCAIWSSNWKSALAGTVLGALGGGSLYDVLQFIRSRKKESTHHHSTDELK